MKIIFDSEEEMKRVIKNLDCPSTFGFKDKFEFENCKRKNCEECIKSAIEIEVKKKSEKIIIGLEKNKMDERDFIGLVTNLANDKICPGFYGTCFDITEEEWAKALSKWIEV